MAEIHRTTMLPGKLELLSRWMPEQPWYRGENGTPALVRAGGFRLDDPLGEVGIEFMFVTDGSERAAVVYHVPLSYRGAPLEGAGVGLLGTAEHGVQAALDLRRCSRPCRSRGTGRARTRCRRAATPEP